MSSVKPFYLTKFSVCPKCDGNKLEHLKASESLGANFDCKDCGQRFNFSDYIKQTILNIGITPLMNIFEKVYYEVNKPR